MCAIAIASVVIAIVIHVVRVSVSVGVGVNVNALLRMHAFDSDSSSSCCYCCYCCCRWLSEYVIQWVHTHIIYKHLWVCVRVRVLARTLHLIEYICRSQHNGIRLSQWNQADLKWFICVYWSEKNLSATLEKADTHICTNLYNHSASISAEITFDLVQCKYAPTHRHTYTYPHTNTYGLIHILIQLPNAFRVQYSITAGIRTHQNASSSK